MTNIELYINGAIMDVQRDIGVRLNRQLLNPSELNTKDAQMSYSISLPFTDTNHRNFGYVNIEETSGKFTRDYDAVLIINSVKVFEGKFRLADIQRMYKGNLYKPVQKSIKDIFGEIKLNQNPELRIPFEDFATSINEYNEAAAAAPQAAIFPYTLYGVLPKVPLSRNENNYSARNIWDASVRLGMQDLAPSLNPLIMLRHIFASQGYSLQGTAFDDERLTRLYMSYKNADDYVQPWNYGQHAKIKINGAWASTYNQRTGSEVRALERGVNRGYDVGGEVYGVDFLDATNTALDIIEDSGGNVLYKEVNDADAVTWVRAQIRIPSSGFYKVEFAAKLLLFGAYAWRTTDPATGIQHIGMETQNAENDLEDNMYEVRLVRDRKSADFGLSSPKIDGVFYRNNQPQNDIFDENNAPKYFPQMTDGQLNMIDLAQDRGHVFGFGWGQHRDRKSDFKNPRDLGGAICQMQAAKPATSWDTSESTDNITRLAVKSLGWWKYGRIGNFDNEGDNPNVDIDYSGGTKIDGDVLDENGNAQTPAGSADLSYRLEGYYLDKITGLQTVPVTPVNNLATRFDGFAISRSSGALGALSLWTASDFIAIDDFTGLTVSGSYPEDSSVAVCAWYDKDKEYLGETLRATTAGTLTAAVFTPVEGAVYMRISCGLEDLTINGTLIVQNWNVSDYIQLSRWNDLEINGATPKNKNVALIAFYDANLDFLGFQLDASIARTLTDVVPAPIATAAYMRITEDAAAPLVVTGTNADTDTTILERFGLSRFYTYKIEAPSGSNYEGFAYVHNGAEIVPLLKVPFVDGVATFNTGFSALLVADPKLTIYLKTKDFDVDGTLTISREIQSGSSDVIDWELSDKYKIDLINAPANTVGRGWSGDGLRSGDGAISGVVWFDAGELISVASVSGEGRYRQNGMHSTFGLVEHKVEFELSIQPFRTDREWLKVGLNGSGTAVMDWDDAPNFDTDSINLVGFLNADQKTDDFIDNFCKAFNLKLSQLDEKTFALDVKQSKTAISPLFIDLDKLASVKDRGNSPLGLPSLYKLGFSVDVEEEGFVTTGDDGGGQYATGATEGDIVEQKSSFSFNWFKQITKGAVVLPLAVISKADVWNPAMSYPEAMRKRYTDLAYRFWYYDGLLNDLGTTFDFNGDDLKIAKVAGSIPNVSVLDYKNRPRTILDNFFTVLISGASAYTEIEAYLTEQHYAALDGSIYGRFNGDLYFIADVTGYDPHGRNKTKIKLIRKI